MQLLLSGTILAVVASFYILLTSLKIIPIAVAIFFAVIAFDFSFAIYFLFKKVSYSYVQSESLLQKVKKADEFKSKRVAAFVKSCSPLKLAMGDGNFFDETTSLVMWQFCIDQLITLLLI